LVFYRTQQTLVFYNLINYRSSRQSIIWDSFLDGKGDGKGKEKGKAG